MSSEHMVTNSPKKQFLYGASWRWILAIVSGLLLASIIGGSVLVWRASHPAPIVAHISAEYITNGTQSVIVNGIYHIDIDNPFIPLVAGENTIVAHLPPFRDKRCTIHWPLQAGDQCLTSDGQSLDLQFIFNDLAPADRTNLQHFLLKDFSQQQQLIAQPTAVHVGDFYQAGWNSITQSPIILQATEPLTALLRVSFNKLVNVPNNCVIYPGHGNIYSLCGYIRVVMQFQATWEFRRGTTIVATSEHPVVYNIEHQLDYYTKATHDFAKGWNDNAGLSNATIDLPNVLYSLCKVANQSLLSSTECGNSTNITEGVFVFGDRVNEFYYYRFGVIVAANDVTHRQHPELPVIDTNIAVYLQTFFSPYIQDATSR